MNHDLPIDQGLEGAANAVAEEILQVIYGEDLEGCAVRLESVASVIRTTMSAQIKSQLALIELYERGIEAMRLLATPPPDGPTLGPDELRGLLGERLDAIRTVAVKISEVTEASKAQAQIATPTQIHPV